MSQYKVSSLVPWFTLIFFGILAFPQWYVLTYTKLWELKQMIGKSRDSQMLVLHPREQMIRLIQLKNALQAEQASVVTVVIPDERTLPLAQNPAFVRGYLQSAIPNKSIQVTSPLELKASETDAFCVVLNDPSQEQTDIHHNCALWSNL